MNPVELFRAIIFGSATILTLSIAFIVNILYHNSRKFKTSLKNNAQELEAILPKKSTTVLLLDSTNSGIFSKFGTQLEVKFQTLRSKNIYEAISLIRQNPIDCVITYLNNSSTIPVKKLASLKIQFPRILLITITNSPTVTASLTYAGTNGDYVLNDCNLADIEKIICENRGEKIFSVNYSEYGINTNGCSQLIQKVLKIIEERYIEINSVKELADELGISREFLSRQFKKCGFIQVKKLLTLVKLHRAIYLMQNPGLNIKEIYGIVGFSNIHHFNKSFQRNFSSSPTTFREKSLNLN